MSDAFMYDDFTPVWGSPYMQPFFWMVLLNLLFAAGVGFAMGANDVANAFGTSVAARVVSIKQACFLAGIFDFVGAIALGGEVTATIRGGIVQLQNFQDTPQVYMAAMTAAYVGTFVFVLAATYFKMPVSTTHAVVGGVLGASLAAYANEGVDWFGAGMVALGWVAAPIFAGIFTAFFYLLQNRYVLGDKTAYDAEKTKIRQIWFASTQAGLVFWLLAFFVLTKTAEKVPVWLQITQLKKDHGPATWPGSLALPLLCFAIMGAVVLIGRFYAIPAIFRAVERDHPVNEVEDDKDVEALKEMKELQETREVPHYTGGDEAVEKVATPKKWYGDFFSLNHEDKPYALEKHVRKQAEELHANADDYPREMEVRFKGIQVLTASFMALSHGANDIANVVGPAAGTFAAWNAGLLDDKSPTSLAVLAFGGFFIVLGLALYGSRVMATIGHNVTKITPSRGVNVELGAAFAVTIASYLGIPVSTTQCVLGSVVAVGLCNKEGLKTVDFKLFGVIFMTWVLTPLISGLISAAAFELFNAVAEKQVPSDFFPLSNSSEVYGRHYSYGGV